MGNNSKSSEKSLSYSESGEVSEFMGKMIASKQIKQKLIGFKWYLIHHLINSLFIIKPLSLQIKC